MKRIELKVTIQGVSNLLMHNARLADPLDQHTKELARLTKKRGGKTDEDHEAIAQAEWIGSVYYQDDIGVCLPAENLRAAFHKALKGLKLGPKISGVNFDHETSYYKLEGPGLRADPHKMKADPKFRLRKCVVVAGSRVMRTRPLIPAGWEATFAVSIDPEKLDIDQFAERLAYCGADVGLGDWRPSAPKSPGPFGRFRVAKVEVVGEIDITKGVV